MANERVGPRYVLDTAESVVAAGTPLRILSVWYEGAADGNVCILHDGNGKVIWKCKLGTVATVGYDKGLSFGGDGIVVDGLDLDTITAGTLYVYLGKL